ncbi:MAG: hypothetical protein HUU22_12125 [Phycisphaerae bacterium]|nr:hypothetical protein [Phycisphaerae bacterium]NUQ46764.1 hypothetical protein [Phycisphaerae bacterium]
MHLVEAVQQHAIMSGAFDQVAAAARIGTDESQKMVLRGSKTQHGVDAQDDGNRQAQRRQQPETNGLNECTEFSHVLMCRKSRAIDVENLNGALKKPAPAGATAWRKHGRHASRY